MVIVANPRQFKIPDWFLNRKKDHKDGRYTQVVSNGLDMKMREDLERLKKIRCGGGTGLWALGGWVEQDGLGNVGGGWRRGRK